MTVPEANFEKGKYYTIVVTGHSKGMPKLQVLMVEDQLGGTPTTASNEKAQPHNGKLVKAKAAKY